MKSLDVLLKASWFSSPCEWFRFAFQRSLKSFRMTPGHGCLRKWICEERLSIENVTFWAPSIFQKLRVPDLWLAESVDSFQVFGFPLKNQWKSTNINEKSIEAYESMKIKGNRRNSWSPNGLLATGYKRQATSCRLQTSALKTWFTNMIWAGGNGRDSQSQYTFQLR